MVDKSNKASCNKEEAMHTSTLVMHIGLIQLAIGLSALKLKYHAVLVISFADVSDQI